MIFHMNFRSVSSYLYEKKMNWSFDKIALNQLIGLGIVNIALIIHINELEGFSSYLFPYQRLSMLHSCHTTDL